MWALSVRTRLTVGVRDEDVGVEKPGVVLDGLCVNERLLAVLERLDRSAAFEVAAAELVVQPHQLQRLARQRQFPLQAATTNGL